MQESQRIGIVACCPDPSGNPRPNRAIQLLNKMGYRVVGLCPTPIQPIDGLGTIFPILKKDLLSRICRKPFSLMLRISVLFRMPGQFRDWLWVRIIGCDHYEGKLAALGVNVILVESLILLPFCLKVARKSNARVILDAREYYPREFESSLKFQIFDSPEKIRLLKEGLPELSAMCTVSEGLASAYGEEFGVLPDVVRSVPPYVSVMPKTVILEPVRLVHHGGANPDRQLENLIEAVKSLSGRYTLDLYLVGNEAYIQRLRSVADGSAFVKFMKPVDFECINEMLIDYDAGICFFAPTTFNLKNCLPNKFFEFVQARLPVITGPTPEIAALVKHYGIGYVSTDFSIRSLIELLASIDRSILLQYKANTQKAAEELCWEKESKVLERLILGNVDGSLQ